MLNIFLISEYDQMIELLGIPWISFLKDNKCGHCKFVQGSP